MNIKGRKGPLISNKSQTYKNQFLLITRIFDNKMKAFIKLIMTKGDIANFSYRIEFQLRGMPHAHGVMWLRKDIIEKIKDGEEYKDDEVVKLIDEWITCSLYTGDTTLDNLVTEVDLHKHTRSCQKGTSKYRFNFPRLPSKQTLIAGPLPPELSDEDRETRLSKSKKILDTVRNTLVELSEEDINEEYENSLDNLLAVLEISYQDYEEALSVSERGRIVILK